jgi:two-component system cell cycle sensor histidine kinase/response regulator CckA
MSVALAEHPRILVVEDDAPLRGMIRRILSGQAYRVLEAGDGAAALCVAASEAGNLDLVITDVEMPTPGGHRMVRELRALSPGVRLLFISGYTDYELLLRGFDKGFDPFLQKPFSGAELVAAVREVMARPLTQPVG